MTMATHRQNPHRRNGGPPRGSIDLVSLAVFFVALVAVALLLVGIATRDTNPLLLLPPTALGFVAILGLRR